MNRVLIAAFTLAVWCGSLRAQESKAPSSGSAPQQQQQTPAAEQPAAPPTEQASPANSPSKIAPRERHSDPAHQDC